MHVKQQMAMVFTFVLSFILVFVLVAKDDKADSNRFDRNELKLQSYLSVCHNQAGYSVGKCLFAWQYPNQAKALNQLKGD